MHKELIGQTEFTFRMLEPHEPLEPIFRLRYQVYCNECNFIKAEDYPDKIEKDAYDQYSLQFVAEDKSGPIGTSRLILDSPLGFPIEKHFSELAIDHAALDRAHLTEVSRLIISKEYRRRRDDGMYYTVEDKAEDGNRDLIKRIRPMAFGLYREMYQESKRRGIKHWFAIMENSLCLLLRLHCFTFHEIGKEIDFYGPVKGYLAHIAEIELQIHQKMPKLSEYFRDGLEPAYLPNFIQSNK